MLKPATLELANDSACLRDVSKKLHIGTYIDQFRFRSRWWNHQLVTLELRL